MSQSEYGYDSQVFIKSHRDLTTAIEYARLAMQDWSAEHGDWRNLQHSIAQAQTVEGDWVFTLFVTVVRVRSPRLVHRIDLTATVAIHTTWMPPFQDPLGTATGRATNQTEDAFDLTIGGGA